MKFLLKTISLLILVNIALLAKSRMKTRTKDLNTYLREHCKISEYRIEQALGNFWAYDKDEDKCKGTLNLGPINCEKNQGCVWGVDNLDKKARCMSICWACATIYTKKAPPTAIKLKSKKNWFIGPDTSSNKYRSLVKHETCANQAQLSSPTPLPKPLSYIKSD